MEKNSKIFIAGHKGLVGSALVRQLKSLGYENLITADKLTLDLRSQAETEHFFNENRPEYVFLDALQKLVALTITRHILQTLFTTTFILLLI